MSLLLSHWYPGSGVVLDCIVSSSLHTYFVHFAGHWPSNYYRHFIIVCIIISRRSFGDTPVQDPRKSQYVTAHRVSPMDGVFIRWEFI